MKTEKREIEALLPWYVNGSLRGDEKARVEAHITASPESEATLNWLRALSETVKQEPQPASPGELGLRRLLRDVRAQPVRRRWQPWLAAAAVLVIVVQSAVLLQMSGQPAVYQPLSGPSAGGPLLQVRFQPHATEAEIREALLDIDAVIVDGPSASGVYRLRLTGPAAEAAARADALRQRGELVLELAPE